MLLSVSNQPIWSDTWALGALFLASGLSVAAAALGLLTRLSSPEPSTEAKLSRADRYFSRLELVLLAVFFVSLGAVSARAPGAALARPVGRSCSRGTLVPLVLPRSTAAPRAVTLAFCLVLVGGSRSGSW